jgi:hypothetical protein
MEILTKDWIERGEKLYGKDPSNHKFKCPHCGRVQSIKSLKEQKKDGVPSKRYGPLTGPRVQNFYCECLSPDCDWVAYGLFHSNIIVIDDPKKSHDPREGTGNASFTFPFADDKEMLEAAGISIVPEKSSEVKSNE